MRYRKDAGLLCPLHEIRAYHSSKHIDVVTNHEAPLSFGVQDFYWVSLYRRAWLYWPCDGTQAPALNPYPEEALAQSFNLLIM